MPRLTQQDALQLLAFEVMRARARHQNAAIIEQMQRCAIERRVMFKTGIVILATLDQARLDDDVVLEIQDALEILQRHVEHQADAARQRLEEPDMRNGRGQLDMAPALAPAPAGRASGGERKGK